MENNNYSTVTPLSYSDPTLNGSSLSGASTGLLQNTMGNLSMGTPVNNTGVVPNVAVQPAAAPGSNIGGNSGGGFWKNGDGSFNTGNLELALGGIQTLGSLWNSYQQHKIAKEQLRFARDTFQENLANQKQTYNTALEDRIRARHHTEGRDASATDAYLNEHRL